MSFLALLSAMQVKLPLRVAEVGGDNQSGLGECQRKALTGSLLAQKGLLCSPHSLDGVCVPGSTFPLHPDFSVAFLAGGGLFLIRERAAVQDEGLVQAPSQIDGSVFVLDCNRGTVSKQVWSLCVHFSAWGREEMLLRLLA